MIMKESRRSSLVIFSGWLCTRGSGQWSPYRYRSSLAEQVQCVKLVSGPRVVGVVCVLPSPRKCYMVVSVCMGCGSHGEEGMVPHIMNHDMVSKESKSTWVNLTIGVINSKTTRKERQSRQKSPRLK